MSYEEDPWHQERMEDLETTVSNLLDYIGKEKFEQVDCTCRYDTGHDPYYPICKRNQRIEEFKSSIRRGY
jgi:hypothetical protein